MASLRFDIVALDRASAVFNRLGDQVERLGRQIGELDRRRANPKIDVDTGAAHAKLAALHVALSRVGNAADRNFGGQQLKGFGGQAALAAKGVGVLGGAMAALGPVAAVAAGGAVLAIGGIGIAAAAQSATVKSAFTGLKDHVVTQMKSLAAPLEPVLVGIAGRFQATFDALAPALGAAFRAVGPQLTTLTGGITTALGAVVPAITRMVQASAPVIAVIAQGLGELGRGAAQFIDALQSGMGGAAQSLGALLKAAAGVLPILGQLVATVATAAGPALTALVPTVLALAQALSSVLGTAITAIAPVLIALAPLFTQIAQVVGGVLVQVIAQLAPPLLLIAQTLTSALLPVLPAIGQAFVAIIVAIAPVIAVLAALAPAFTAIAQVVAQVLTALAPLITLLAGVFTQVLTALAPVIAKVAQIIGDAVVGAVNALMPLLPPLIASFMAIVNALAPLIPPLVQIAVTIASALLPILPILADLFLQVVSALLPILPPLVELIQTLLPPLIDLLKFLLPILATVAKVLITVVAFAISNVLVPVLNFLVDRIQHVGSFFTWLWTDVVVPVWNGITTAISTAWQFLSGLFVSAAATLSSIWQGLWAGIQTVATTVWNAISGFFTGAFAAFTGFFTAIWVNIRSVFATVWTSIRDTGIAIWNGIRDFFGGAFAAFTGFFVGIWNGIRDAFGRAWGAVRDTAVGVWEGIKGVFRGGVNAVLGAVNWLIDQVNKVLGFLHIPTIGRVPLLAEGGVVGVPGLAAGGRVGPGFITAGPTAIVGEGDRRHPEFVIPTDPRHRGRALALYESLGGHLMQEGGILGWIGDKARVVWNGVTSVASAVGGAISDAAAWVSGGVGNLLGKIVDAVTSMIPVGMFRDVGVGVARSAFDGIRKMITDAFSVAVPAGGGGVGGGAGQWAGVVLQALRIMGQPASLLGTVLRRLNQESGGNASVVNRWDINARRGTPSVGLMQVIGPTYRAYRFPGYDVGPYIAGTSINPLANILASMRYALARYGSLAAAYNRRGGYANGGIFTSPTFGLLGESGPEALVPLTRPRRAAEVMRAAGIGPDASLPVLTDIRREISRLRGEVVGLRSDAEAARGVGSDRALAAARQMSTFGVF